MKNNFSGKATRQSVSVPLDMMEEVQRQLQKRGGNFSAYIQDLIAKDLSCAVNTPDSSDQQALVRLTEKFHPTAMAEIRNWAEGMVGFQQPFFIYRMLCALHDAITNNRPSLTLNLTGK
jgi:hypothetical protein